MNVYQDPTADTATGAAFVREGKVDLFPDGYDPFTAKAADSAGAALLGDVQVGRELKLFLLRAADAPAPDTTAPPATYLVRRRLSDSGGTFVRLSDRLDKLKGVPA